MSHIDLPSDLKMRLDGYFGKFEELRGFL